MLLKFFLEGGGKYIHRYRPFGCKAEVGVGREMKSEIKKIRAGCIMFPSNLDYLAAPDFTEVGQGGGC